MTATLTAPKQLTATHQDVDLFDVIDPFDPVDGVDPVDGIDRNARPTDPRISIVIPTINEARNLREVLPTLPKVHEVILVDGGSTDDTVEVARQLLPDVRVFQQTRRGKGNALAVGFEQVTGDIVIMFDADGSADAAEIPRFVGALMDGADFAKGSRFASGGGSLDITPIRRLGNEFLNQSANLAFGTSFTDLCYGYNAFWADMIAVLDLPGTSHGGEDDLLWGDGFEIETMINCRMAAADSGITEVPSVELERIHGDSNLNAVKDGLRVLYTIFTERVRHGAARRARRRARRRTPSQTQQRAPDGARQPALA
jgi:glycosyltransferase involved in cell wall biosynthesis